MQIEETIALIQLFHVVRQLHPERAEALLFGSKREVMQATEAWEWEQPSQTLARWREKIRKAESVLADLIDATRLQADYDK